MQTRNFSEAKTTARRDRIAARHPFFNSPPQPRELRFWLRLPIALILISVIIPTRLDHARHAALHRALSSIRAQQGVPARIIIVANGPQIDRPLMAALATQADVQMLHLPAPGLKAAQLAGRDAVTTPFFCFLDDDDEYLPGALTSRIAPMLADPSIDAVVGRGFRIEEGQQRPSGRASDADPLDELTRHNWLTSCGAVYRSARVGREFFIRMPRYFEWTWLAFDLCLTRRLHFIDHRGHLIHDTPGSLSKSTAYHRSHSSSVARLLTLDLPQRIRQQLRIQQGRALHDLAEHYRQQRAWRPAWGAHLKSLMQPQGFRFAAYTRKLFGS